MTCSSYILGAVPEHLAPLATTWSSWERYCWAVMVQQPGYPVALLVGCT